MGRAGFCFCLEWELAGSVTPPSEGWVLQTEALTYLRPLIWKWGEKGEDSV